MDPELVVPVCHDDHELVGDDRRTLDVPDDRPASTLFDRVLVRLQRLAIDASRFAEAHPDWRWVARVAAALARWAGELERGIRHLDQRDPAWRADPGFYPDGSSA